MRDYRTQRKRCPACQQMRPMRPRQRACSVPCSVKLRQARGDYQRLGQLKASRKIVMTLAGFGVLTERERRIYQRGRANALTYSRAQQRDAGRRAGWAEALGERDEQGAA